MKNFKNKEAGISIISILVFAALAILVLSYFNISIKAVVDSPTGQENVNYVKGGTQNLWTTYLQGPVSYLWNDVWVKDFWRPFISNIEKINSGQPNDFINAAPQINFTQ